MFSGGGFSGGSGGGSGGGYSGASGSIGGGGSSASGNPIVDAIVQSLHAKSGGLGQLISGFTGHSDRPYQKYGEEYSKYANEAKEYQNPFFNAGKQAIGNYQDWSNTMKDPTEFINHLMNNYQQSPYAKFQMQQGQNAANNAASASGLLGSTPFARESANYARDISSQDQNQWLQNVLGASNQYGSSQGNLMSSGQNAANVLSQLQELLGQNMGDVAYGKEAGRNMDRGNKYGGALSLLFG